MKPCQFCGESMNSNAYLCTSCNHTQRNRGVILIRYVHLQAVRYFPIALSTLVPLVVALYLSIPEVYFIAGVFQALQLFYGFASLYVLGIIMLRFIPDSFLQWMNMNLPDYLESIKHVKGMAVWNWILFPILGSVAIYGVLNFAEAKPSNAEFQAFVKANISRRAATEQIYDCQLFSLYGVGTKQDGKMYLCAGGRISPLDPSYFEHLSD